MGRRVLKCNQIFKAQIYLETHNNKLGEKWITKCLFSIHPSIYQLPVSFNSRNKLLHDEPSEHLPSFHSLPALYRVVSWFHPGDLCAQYTNHNLRIEEMLLCGSVATSGIRMNPRMSEWGKSCCSSPLIPFDDEPTNWWIRFICFSAYNERADGVGDGTGGGGRKDTAYNCYTTRTSRVCHSLWVLNVFLLLSHHPPTSEWGFSSQPYFSVF